MREIPKKPAMLTVVALGGNALLRRGERPDLVTQERNADAATRALGALGPDVELVITHGNGPQVGLLALQAESTAGAGPYPLDALGAESEGLIGYLLERSLANHRGHPAATLLTQTIVDAGDDAFDHPTKPIGPAYSEAVAQKLAVERGWSMAPDGDSFRRVVPSPPPLRIVELEAIRHLVTAGVTVICCGGGGVPVTLGPGDDLRGIEAVVDKDLTSALLAIDLGAERLVLLTDVDGLYRDWNGPDQALIETIDAGALAELELPSGSMGPKAEACRQFVERTGRSAAIGSLSHAAEVIAGDAGTRVVSAPIAAG